jgi:cytidylate kinase
LIDKGFSANIDGLLQDLRDRDARDSGRTAAPLVPAEGAFLLDSTHLDVEQTVGQVMGRWAGRG